MEPGLRIVKNWALCVRFLPLHTLGLVKHLPGLQTSGFQGFFLHLQTPTGEGTDASYLIMPTTGLIGLAWVLQSPPKQHSPRPLERCLQSPSWWHTQQERMKRTISTLKACVHCSVLNLPVVDNFCSFVTFHRPPCTYHSTELPRLCGHRAKGNNFSVTNFKTTTTRTSRDNWPGYTSNC